MFSTVKNTDCLKFLTIYTTLFLIVKKVKRKKKKEKERKKDGVLRPSAVHANHLSIHFFFSQPTSSHWYLTALPTGWKRGKNKKEKKKNSKHKTEEMRKSKWLEIPNHLKSKAVFLTLVTGAEALVEQDVSMIGITWILLRWSKESLHSRLINHLHIFVIKK